MLNTYIIYIAKLHKNIYTRKLLEKDMRNIN